MLKRDKGYSCWLVNSKLSGVFNRCYNDVATPYVEGFYYALMTLIS